MFLGFGKKKRTTRKRTTGTVSKKEMYCIKRTKAGNRIAKVVNVKKGNKVVKVYASTKRAVGKTVKCYPNKSSARAAMRSSTKGSSFGAKRAHPGKITTSYGFTVCIDVEPDMGYSGIQGHKHKVYKYYPIRVEGETYNIVAHKMSSGEYKIFRLPEEAKRFKVKSKGSASEIDKSKKLAKEKASRLAKQYQLLGHIGVNLVPCDPNMANAISSTGSPISKYLKFADLSGNGVSSQLASYNSLNKMYESAVNSRNGIYNGTSSMLKVYEPYSKSIGPDGRINVEYTHNGNRETARYNPYTGSARGVGGVPLRQSQYKSATSFGRRRRSNGFGRINYGFSKFF